MPSKKRIQNTFIEEFLNSRSEDAKLASKTISKYRMVLNSAVTVLDQAGLNYNPRKIGKLEIKFLQKNHFVNNSASYNRWQLSIFNEWLEWYDNQVVRKMNIPWPSENRINVDWLEPYEAIQMQRAAQGIEKLIIHLELNLGLRRVDMYRLQISDVHDGYFDVLGKGRCGGKKRTVSWDQETSSIIREYLIHRNELIEKARKINSKVKEPEGLLIYQKGKRLGEYQLTAIDNIVIRVAKRAGISRKITNHTLRRTCGRLLYLAGVEIESIADILGHSETRTTLKYLGIRLDDQKKAMDKRGEYLKNIEKEMVKNV